MTDFNRAIVAGRLTHDPDLKYVSSGRPVCQFSLAINSHFTDKAGQKKDEATFIPVTVWGKQAETVAEYLKKGRAALIEGRIKQERWKNKDGQDRSRLIIVAGIVRFLGSPPKADEGKPPIENKEPPDGTAQDETERDIPF